MQSVVLTTKVDPSYDDLPEERYHFPRTYLRTIEAAVGGLALYYEPRRTSADPASRGGRQAYFALARITNVTEDPRRKDHYYAHIRDYVEFVRPVPFRVEGRTPERRLTKGDGSTNKGAFGRAVRQIPEAELAEIVSLGFAGASETPLVAADDTLPERLTAASVLTRPVRDRAFREVVRRAYDNTCALTGLRLVNGGGAAEIEAAHIHPVAHGGPDSPRNGLALSRTVHWMFDRFLFTVEDDLTVRVPAENTLPEGLVRPGARLILPDDPVLRPHPNFLRWHRQHFEQKHGSAA